MSEQELREALREYAGPLDPPAGGRDEILARVAAHQRRFRLSAGIAAAAAVATVVAGGLMLRPDGGSPRPQPLDGWQPERTSTAPYEAAPCGDVTYLGEEPLPEIGEVVSVRYCTDRQSRLAGEPVVVDEGLPEVDPEALVFGLPAFGDALDALDVTDEARCAAIDVMAGDDALVFTLRNGRQMKVFAGFCADVHSDHGRLDGHAVTRAFLEALDRQREQTRYERDLGVPAGCDPRGMAGPLRPGRETFRGARVCTPGQDQRDLSRPALDRLNAAWADAEAGRWQPDEDRDECLDLDATHPRLLVWSNRGDLLRLTESPCGFLFADSHRLGEHWRIPVTLDELA